MPPLRLVLLTREPRNHSSLRVRSAAKAAGHQLRALNPLTVSLGVEAGNPSLFRAGSEIPHYDAVIPRIGASVTSYGCAVVRQFEQMGVFTLNSANAISLARDKLRSLQVLSVHGVGMPPTAFARAREEVLPAIRRVGGAPVIIKLLEGTQGIGVILADTEKMAEAIIETLQSASQSVLIQKFVAESRGTDLRAFVVGGRVVAAMRRSAQPGEFRSNVHRGGTVERVELNAEQESTAVRAAQVLGLHVAGVDMLEGKDGPQIMEVNSSPGLQGIEKATGLDVAGAIIEHLSEQILVPEMDVRQRLTLKSGYGLAELVLAPDSPFIGQTVVGTGLRDKDVIILSILRRGSAIPNPRQDREILGGDVLVCFGDLKTLRDLSPTLPRKRGGRKARPKAASP